MTYPLNLIRTIRRCSNLRLVLHLFEQAVLEDGSIVAVKKLHPTEQNTAEFFREMVNITGIKHRNLIQLLGCCVREKQQRMLVYEFAENRSLAEALWGTPLHSSVILS